MLSEYWLFWRREEQNVTRIAVQVNTGQSPNVVLMPGQRQKRWASIETVLGKWYVFAGVLLLSMQQTQCWSSPGPAS